MFFKKTPSAGGAPEYLIVGLGNPGQQYENTRHNAGFRAVDALAGALGCELKRIQFKGLTGTAALGGHRVLLLKPSTYMNLSGESVRDALEYYKIPVERLLVFVDDISLDPGRLRIRRKGSAGGHNGLKSIIYLLGRDDSPGSSSASGRNPIRTTTWLPGCSAVFQRRTPPPWTRPVPMRRTSQSSLSPGIWRRP